MDRFASSPGGQIVNTVLAIRMILMACLLSCVLSAHQAIAREGDLDPSFGQGGIALYPLSENGSCLAGANAVAVHPDGSIWIAGWVRDAAIPERDAAYLKIDARGNVLFSDFGYEQTELRGIAIDAATGEIYVAGNQGNVVSVRALNSDGSFDTGFGNNGVRGIAIDGDMGHQTTVNDLQLDAGGSLYLTGDYNGSGQQQAMLAYLTSDGTLQAAQAVTSDPTDHIATSLAIQPPDGHLLVSGYTSGLCATEDFDVTFTSGFHFTPDAGFSSPLYGPTDQACFVDASAVLPADGSLREAGRVVDNTGTWTAMWQKVDANGALTQAMLLFHMSPWGDNSPRKVLLVKNGTLTDSIRWVVVGFTGVDATGTPGAWAGRFRNDGSFDPLFGNGGSTLINFDPQDNASGQAFGAAQDRYGRIIIVGTYDTGTSDPSGNDCTEIFAARLQGLDTIFRDGFDG